MPALPDFKVSPSVQPRPEDYDYDLEKALTSVVGLHAIIPNDAKEFIMQANTVI